MWARNSLCLFLCLSGPARSLEQQVRIEDSHAAIVTPEEFERAQKVIMLQHGNHQAGNYTKHQYPLKARSTAAIAKN